MNTCSLRHLLRVLLGAPLLPASCPCSSSQRPPFLRKDLPERDSHIPDITQHQEPGLPMSQRGAPARPSFQEPFRMLGHPSVPVLLLT